MLFVAISLLMYSLDMRKSILSWLSASMVVPVPSNNYDGALEKHLSDTASWVFKEDHFMQWKQGSNSFLQSIGMRELTKLDILMVD